MATAAPETPRTEVRAEARYVRTAPRKAALVADQIRGRTVPEARTILAFMTRDAARDVSKVLDSAVANAEANHGLAGDDLFVSAAFVGAGPTLKRWRARARGRVARIKKRTCHITVELALPSGEEIPAPLPQPEIPAPAAEEPEASPEEEKPKRTPRKKAEEPASEGGAGDAGRKPKRTTTKKAEVAEDQSSSAKPKASRRGS
jgi:large subunit ribosomal protein L22